MWQHGDWPITVSFFGPYINNNRYWEYIVSKEIEYQWNRREAKQTSGLSLPGLNSYVLNRVRIVLQPNCF